MARPNEDGNIVCTGCERELPGTVEYFHRHRDAFKPKCKECRGSSFGVKSPNKVYDAKDGHKFCSSCHEELPATDGYFFNGGKDENGLTSQCKKCMDGVEYGTHRPNRGREDGLWECKECGETYDRTQENFYTSGREERPGRATDGLMVYCKECHTELTNKRRRKLVNEVNEDLSVGQWNSILEDFNHSCAYCGAEGKKLEKDHIVPLSDGGDTIPENIIPACETCNRSKGHNDPIEWYRNQDFHTQEREDRIFNVQFGRMRV